MTLALNKNDVQTGCFAACARGFRLLITLAEAQDAQGVGEAFVPPARLKYGYDFMPTLINKMNLIRCGICRGKISRRQNRTNLKERTQLAPNQ